MTSNPLNQSMLALERANEIRLARASLHREVARKPTKAGEKRVAALISDPPPCLDSLQVRKLLGWIDQWGPVRVDRLLRRLEIALRRDVTVYELTDRQRTKLAAALNAEDEL